MNKETNDVERPFVIDGIKEYDNPLPSWWVLLFWFTIIFGVAYLAFLHVFSGPTLEDELMADRAAYKQLMTQQEASAAGDSPQDLLSAMEDSAMIAAGKEHYTVNCAPCHGQGGQGLVGPNLTDKYWIHGGSPEDIMKTITDGVPAKGMVPWKAILGTKKIKEVTAFVYSLEGTNPANGKAPEGELYER